MKIKLRYAVICGLFAGCLAGEAKDYSVQEARSRVILFDLYRGATVPSIKPVLENAGYQIRKSDVAISAESLNSVEALWIAADSGREYQADEIRAIKAFVKDGGTVICAGQAWAWVGDKREVDAFPLNQLGKELGFRITGLNIGEPSVLEQSLYLSGIQSLTRNEWWPSKVEPLARNYEILIRDPDDKPMAMVLPVGKGRVFVFGNAGLLWDNPRLVLNILNNR